MKRLITVLLIFMCMVLTGQAQNNVGINDNNSSPNASAMLDVFSTTKGMLVPRIALTATTAAAPVTTPLASLLVYNTATAGDVTPGYYYWNGSAKWVRLVAGTDPKVYNSVAKSASATLLKTENMVFASGDITLTLPAVTSADDGLEISIKNTGTFTDLITVVPEAGKQLDASTSSLLTRWKGRTFIARGSNWIVKEKESRTDNILEVSAAGSFTTIAEVVAFLNVHMTGPTVVILGAGKYQVAATQTINRPFPLTFEGLSFGETSIDAAAGVSGNPLFICATECYFKKLMFNNAISNAVGNDAIHFTGSGTYYEVKDSYFVGFNKGIVSTTNNDLWIFETDFEACNGAGIEIAAGGASGGSLKLSESDFTNCAIGINLLSGVSETVSILNSTFYNTSADIGILYTPLSFTSFSSMFITGNAWNNQGTYMSGFDFSRADGRDANAFLANNAGMEDEKPHCRISVNNNALTTTITTVGTYYKANWNTTSAYTCKWALTNNKMVYLPNNGRDAWAIITGNVANSVNGHVITIAIIKSGTGIRYGETDLRILAANQPMQFSTVIYIPDMKKNEYLELYVTSNTNGDVVTFQDIQWLTNTQ